MENNTDIEPPTLDTPIVCTLPVDAATEQVLEWSAIQHHALAVTAIAGGVRMTLPATMVDGVEDLARRESSCCAFLTLGTSVIDDVLTLEVTSPNPDALPVIEAMAGTSLHELGSAAPRHHGEVGRTNPPEGVKRRVRLPGRAEEEPCGW